MESGGVAPKATLAGTIIMPLGNFQVKKRDVNFTSAGQRDRKPSARCAFAMPCALPLSYSSTNPQLSCRPLWPRPDHSRHRPARSPFTPFIVQSLPSPNLPYLLYSAPACWGLASSAAFPRSIVPCREAACLLPTIERHLLAELPQLSFSSPNGAHREPPAPQTFMPHTPHLDGTPAMQ
jgi:hypothetical protein